LRQDSWTGRRAPLALPESRPLSRRSGCVSAEPCPPLRSVQSTRDEAVKKYGRLHKTLDARESPEQYQLFDTPEYSYRVFVTNITGGIALLTWLYNQRAGAENLIKEAKNDAGLTAHPSGRWSMNCIYFQFAMLAYNLNCWLMLFNREERAKLETLRHTTLATARLKFLFLAARIWRHAGRVGVSYSDHYADRSLFERLMTRLRSVATNQNGFAPVIAIPLRC
jgi:hypothetical protein